MSGKNPFEILNEQGFMNDGVMKLVKTK